MYKLQYNTASGPVEESFDNLFDAVEQWKYLNENGTAINNIEGAELIEWVKIFQSKQEDQR